MARYVNAYVPGAPRRINPELICQQVAGRSYVSPLVPTDQRVKLICEGVMEKRPVVTIGFDIQKRLDEVYQVLSSRSTGVKNWEQVKKSLVSLNFPSFSGRRPTQGIASEFDLGRLFGATSAILEALKKVDNPEVIQSLRNSDKLVLAGITTETGHSNIVDVLCATLITLIPDDGLRLEDKLLAIPDAERRLNSCKSFLDVLNLGFFGGLNEKIAISVNTYLKVTGALRPKEEVFSEILGSLPGMLEMPDVFQPWLMTWTTINNIGSLF